MRKLTAPAIILLLTSITFCLHIASTVSLQVYDSKGSSVKTITHDAWKRSGNHTLQWDGRNEYGETVAGEIYIIQVNGGTSTNNINVIANDISIKLL